MALQHLRTSTAHKRPIPSVMSAGQLAVNINEASPGLFFKDSNGDLVKVGPVHIGTNAPNSSPASVAADALVIGTVYQILTVGTSDFTLVGASANTIGTVFTATGTTTGTGTVSGQQGVEKGEQWLDTTGGTYVLKIYDGTAWRSESGTFVDVNGDTMTGALLLDNASSDAAPDLSFDGDADTGIYSPGADQVAISTGGTGRLFVNNNGNVSIGTTTAQAKLDVRTGAAGFAQFAHASGSGGVRITGEGGSSDANLVFSNNRGVSTSDEYTIQLSGADDALVFRSGGPADTERLRITSVGNVGIGATTVDELLHVESSSTTVRVKVESTAANSYPGVRFTNDARTYDLQIDGATDALRFYDATASSERMRIDSSGRLLIGTSVSPSSGDAHAQAAPLLVQGRIGSDADSGRINLQRGSAASSGSSIGTISFTDSSNNAYARIEAEADGATGANDYPGRLVFSTTADGAPSPTTALTINRNGMLGINETNPGHYIDMNIGSNDIGMKITSTDGGTYIEFVDNNTSAQTKIGCEGNEFVFDVNGGEKARIDSSGRFLVGTAAGDGQIEVRDTNGIISRAPSTQATDTNKAYRARNNSTTDTFSVSYKGQGYFAGDIGGGTSSPRGNLHLHSSSATRFDLTNTATGTASGDGSTISIDGSTGALNIIQREAQPINFSTSNTQKAIIDSAGQVGIGLSDPGSLVHTKGTRDYTGSTPNAASYDANFQSGTAFVGIGQSNGVPAIQGHGTGTSYNLALAPNVGNVGIGSTGPTERLTVIGPATSASNLTNPVLLGNIGTHTNNGHKQSEGVAIGFQLKRGNDGAGANTAFIKAEAEADLGASWPTALTFGTRRFGANPVEHLRLTSGGQMRLAGAGITFNGDTATANELDDYEEGTFTPVLTFGSGTTGITYNGRAGFYVKIGKVVHVWLYFNLSSKGTATGAAAVSQFPFTSEDINVSGLGNWPGAQPSRKQNQTSSNLALSMIDNTINAAITDGAGVSVTDSTFTDGTIIECAFCYRAA